jgi:hypothetical protein
MGAPSMVSLAGRGLLGCAAEGHPGHEAFLLREGSRGRSTAANASSATNETIQNCQSFQGIR